MQNQNLTGYPSIDKPWLKYYTNEAIETPITELSIYEYLRENNQGNEDHTAIVYIGRKISYVKLFASIEDVAKAFNHLGLCRGDVVACIAPSFPEVIYSFYAANKLGAVSDYFDPRSEVRVVQDELEQIQPRIFLIFEDFLPKFQEMIDKLNIPHVLVVSAKDSLPFPLKALAGLKRKPIPANYKPFAQILKAAKDEMPVKTVSGITHEVALMEHTGGTTGVPKAVCLSNQNVNAVVQQYDLGIVSHSKDESWLGIGFPFVAYCIIVSHHLPLCFGMAVHLVYSLYEDMIRYIIKNKINHISNTPVTWEMLINHKIAKDTDFSFLINPTVGADSMSVEKENAINHFLESHNCKSNICKGYGMTEVSSGVSVVFNNAMYKVGSVGIPFSHTIISIFDTETGEEVKYGQQGEICISGPNVMRGYYNNPEETAKVLKVHKDGKVWIHSGDLGHMDEDGFLFIDGRIKRMIINHDGFKIFAPEIEKVLSKHESVGKCCVVSAPDTQYKTGQIAVAFVIQKQGCAVTEEALRELCKKELPDYYMPGKFIFTEQFPYTSAAKVDYRKLEEMAREM